MVMRPWLFLIVIASSVIAGCQTVNPQTPALVEYERSGGITGQTVRLVIQDNGSARLYTRAGGGDSTSLAVGADTLERLKSLLQGIRFDTLRADYRPSQAGADRYEYVIAHRGRRVRLQDGAVPADLQPLITALNGLVRSRR